MFRGNKQLNRSLARPTARMLNDARRPPPSPLGERDGVRWQLLSPFDLFAYFVCAAVTNI